MRQRGFQLVEAVVVLAIVAASLVVSIPPVMRWTSALRLRLATAEFTATLRLARSTAVTTGAKVGVKFRPRPSGRVTFTLHRDGDGDGVRTRDIDDGTDRQIGPEHQLQHVGAHVRLGFPPGIVPRDPGNPGRRLDRLDDPIRFNRSDIAAFNTLGQGTPGSLYLTDGQRGLTAVRVLGATGRVRVLVYDVTTERWHHN